MEKEFRILSIKEEQQLSRDDLTKYYKELREYLLQRKLTNTTPGATTIAPKLKKITNKIAEATVKAFTSKNVEILCEGTENIPEGPVIFAQTHQGILDNFIWIPQINKHSLLLHGQEVNKLLIACQLNTGLIFVKKGDKENNNNAKLDMINLLLNGNSITYFPEGTWNLSPNKLHLPLSFGFVDIAKKAKVPIVPVVHEYIYEKRNSKEVITKIHSKYGEPIYVLEEDNLNDKLMEYEEKISTLKYEIYEKKGIFKRKEIDNNEYIDFLKTSYKNLKLGQLDLKKEKENIFSGKAEFYKFHHINDVPFDENGNLLDTEEVIKIKTLNKKHGI